MQVLNRSGTPLEKKWAARIEPVRISATLHSQTHCKDNLRVQHFNVCLPLQVLRRPHFLLVTLVLCNAAATEVGARGISSPLECKARF